MKWEMRPYFSLRAFKMLFTTAMTLWAVAATLLLFRKDTILIGIDENGVRVISDERDHLVVQEKINLVKRFLIHQNNFDSKDYGEKITSSGNLMSSSLWRAKSDDFLRFKESLKQMPEYRQDGFIEELRQVDDYTFEADLVITENKKLNQIKSKKRVEVKVSSHRRNLDNPYSWEVTEYAETIL